MTITRLAAAAVALILCASTAIAQPITTVATFPADAAARSLPGWSVFTRQTSAGKECWIASTPTSAVTNPAGRFRDPIVFTILILTAQANHQQPSVDVGYPLATDVTVTIDGGEAFTMVVYPEANDNEKAWLETDTEDDLLVAAMRRGQQMIVRGRSQAGTGTTDTYSLSGVTAALDRAAQECR